jgi:hypothetical protein
MWAVNLGLCRRNGQRYGWLRCFLACAILLPLTRQLQMMPEHYFPSPTPFLLLSGSTRVRVIFCPNLLGLFDELSDIIPASTLYVYFIWTKKQVGVSRELY